MNLAIPLWLFSDPIPPNQNKDVDYDPILMGPVKSIPPSKHLPVPKGYKNEKIDWTNWDTIDVEGPKTLGQAFEQLKTSFGVDPSIVTLGKQVIYSIYPMKEEYKKRLSVKIDDIYAEVSGAPFPAHRRYIPLTVSGSLINEKGEEVDANMPIIRYKVK